MRLNLAAVVLLALAGVAAAAEGGDQAVGRSRANALAGGHRPVLPGRPPIAPRPPVPRSPPLEWNQANAVSLAAFAAAFAKDVYRQDLFTSRTATYTLDYRAPDGGCAKMTLRRKEKGLGGYATYWEDGNTPPRWRVLAFKGTKTLNDWLDDLNALRVPCTTGKPDEDCGKVHRGFQGRFEEARTWMEGFLNFDSIDTATTTFLISGHSLGGAISTLTAHWIASKGYKVHLVTFGSPRVGNSDFARSFESVVKTYFRFVNQGSTNDPVSMVPPPLLFKHVGQLIPLDNSDVPASKPIDLHKDNRYYARVLDWGRCSPLAVCNNKAGKKVSILPQIISQRVAGGGLVRQAAVKDRCRRGRQTPEPADAGEGQDPEEDAAGGGEEGDENNGGDEGATGGDGDTR
ncbi:Alpha/Beta hydrolase protein [Hyaloraphidium curvatum]|nr:Alpha/Beta hydrolase protein [Hyaloraphidium curvatum]